jgi:hypothetical protein
MPQRVFTSEDQLAFAKLSGDYNPLHMDPILARRLMFGKQIVHGLHTLLWSLDNYLKPCTRPLRLETVKADFKAGIGIGQTVICQIAASDDNLLEMQLELSGKPAAWFQLILAPAESLHSTDLPQSAEERPKCRERSPLTMATLTGSLALYYDPKSAAQLFPNLVRCLPAEQLAALLATTRLVGMECPGLHSVFSGLYLTFDSTDSPGTEMNYQVKTCNERLALVLMEVEAAGISGRIKAFLRPAPFEQSALPAIGREIEPGEFSEQQALIIGGSRGLGEVTAKLLAAGGAEVIITYFRGANDARKIVDEIVSYGAGASCHPLDVLVQSHKLLDMVGNIEKPLYLYYFASPPIFDTVKGRFSSRRLTTFFDYYVTGFLRIAKKLVDSSSGLQKIFYPSTSAIEELPPDLAEYATAKAVGEILCDFLQEVNPGLIIHKPRLPRTATDQTVSLLPVDNQDPVQVLLPHLRKLRDF